MTDPDTGDSESVDFIKARQHELRNSIISTYHEDTEGFYGDPEVHDDQDEDDESPPTPTDGSLLAPSTRDRDSTLFQTTVTSKLSPFILQSDIALPTFVPPPDTETIPAGKIRVLVPKDSEWKDCESYLFSIPAQQMNVLDTYEVSGIHFNYWGDTQFLFAYNKVYLIPKDLKHGMISQPKQLRDFHDMIETRSDTNREEVLLFLRIRFKFLGDPQPEER